MVVGPTGEKVRVKFGDSRSNHFRDIRLPHYCERQPDAVMQFRFLWTTVGHILDRFHSVMLDQYALLLTVGDVHYISGSL